MTPSTASPYVRDASDHDAPFVDRVMQAAPAEVQDKVRRYPLSREQTGVLRCLLEYGHGDFLWSNASTTERLLQALVNKGLAVRSEQPDRWGNLRGQYRPLTGMHTMHREYKDALERARQAERAEEEAARAARVAANRAALERDVAVLNEALDALAAQGTNDPAALITARERVARMRQTSDLFLG